MVWRSRPLEDEHLGKVVVRVSKSDGQINFPRGGGGWTACSELLKGVEVHEVEATASIHEGFSEPGRID
jgi:hypothetical protein